MAKFRKRPVLADAVRINQKMIIQTLNGMVEADAGEWLVTGVEGEQYPCSDEIFRKTYEPADEDAEEMFRRKDENVEVAEG